MKPAALLLSALVESLFWVYGRALLYFLFSTQHFIGYSNNCQTETVKQRAVSENRTHDLFPTKEVLYHWATTAFMSHWSQRICQQSQMSLVTYQLIWLLTLFQSGRRGSNSPPIAWKAIALPNELLPQISTGTLAKVDKILLRTYYFNSAVAEVIIDKVGRVGFEPTYTYVNRFTVCRL